MNFQNLVYMMRMRGLQIPRLYTLNMVRHHNRGSSGETWKHYLCKCVCAKILYDSNHEYLTEYEFKNKVVADVFDLTTWTAIEFETTAGPKKESVKLASYVTLTAHHTIRDVIVIDISKLPDDWAGIERALRKRLGL